MSFKVTPLKTPKAPSIRAVKASIKYLNFDNLPDSGFVREAQLFFKVVPLCPIWHSHILKHLRSINIETQEMSPKVTPLKTPATPSIQAVKASIKYLNFDDLPDSGFVREAQLVQSPKRPGVPTPLPFSAPTLWRKVRAGTFVKPIKLSERVTCWKVGDVRSWMAAQIAA